MSKQDKHDWLIIKKDELLHVFTFTDDQTCFKQDMKYFFYSQCINGHKGNIMHRITEMTRSNNLPNSLEKIYNQSIQTLIY